MASPGLATNRDASYADSGADPSVKLHQQDHDLIGTMLNRFDNANATVVGQALVASAAGASTLLVFVRVQMASFWNTGTSRYEPDRPTWATGYGWHYISTNSATAADPNAANSSAGTVGPVTGDIWDAHPDAA